MRDLSAERVREVLDYDSLTGEFHWRRDLGRARKGALAGYTTNDGYRLIRIDRGLYRAHRLAWLHRYGHWPTQAIDHRNGDRLDNRIANLREATSGENGQNVSKPNRNNASGTLGVWQYRTAHKIRWRAEITVDRRLIHIGVFDTCEEAAAAYLAVKKVLHPFWDQETA